MNLDPRFKSDDRANLSQADPLQIKIPAWFPARGITTLVLVAAAMCVACVTWWDQPIARAFAHLKDAPWVTFFRIITVLGSSAFWYTPAVMGFGLALWIAKHSPQMAVNWEWKRRARSILFLITSMLVSGSIINALKILFGRHRPPRFLDEGIYGFDFMALNLQSSSFPSGHTQSITAAMVALGFLWPSARVLFWGLAVIVAASRVVITMHYVADVIAGATIAISVAWAMKRYYERNGIALRWTKP
jgi:membrane-associated phospholipid phosphatase